MFVNYLSWDGVKILMPGKIEGKGEEGGRG